MSGTLASTLTSLSLAENKAQEPCAASAVQASQVNDAYFLTTPDSTIFAGLAGGPPLPVDKKRKRKHTKKVSFSETVSVKVIEKKRFPRKM